MVLWFGAHDVLAGRMTGGQLSQFVLYAVLGASSLGQLSETWGEIIAAAGAAERIGEILRIVPRIVAPAVPTVLPVPVRGTLAFDHVGFSYPSRQHEPGAAPALHNLAFTVRPGETVAIVGLRVPARRRCSSCCCASTIPPPAASCSTASTSASSTLSSCARRSAPCRRSR